jgi:hypothetical protein
VKSLVEILLERQRQDDLERVEDELRSRKSEPGKFCVDCGNRLTKHSSSSACLDCRRSKYDYYRKDKKRDRSAEKEREKRQRLGVGIPEGWV